MSTITTQDSADAPKFDMNTVPIWAIDAIKHIRRVVTDCTIVSFIRNHETVGTPAAIGVLRIHIANDGYYYTFITKREMAEYTRLERLGGKYTNIPPMFPLFD